VRDCRFKNRCRGVPVDSRSVTPGSVFAFLLALALSACDILSLGDDQRLGVIQFYGDTSEIAVPGVVQSGSGFTVAFFTFGGGCVTQGHTNVQVAGTSVVITPIDVHSGSDICTADLRFLDHTTSVRLNETGVGSVVIRGQVEPGGQLTQRTFSILVE